MTRAAFISCGGDPFIAATVLKLLKKNCWDVLDAVYLTYNNSCEIPLEVQSEFIAGLIEGNEDNKVKFVYWPTALGYGLPVTHCLSICKEDLVLLLEDDGFVFDGSKVDECFKRIESGEVDAVGSPRFSCGVEIAEALKQKYDLDYSGFGDVGPNFWPNFFFCKASDLRKTDLDFAPKSFEVGVFYPELGRSLSQTESADTFGWTTMQMRHNGVRFGTIQQYHSDPYEIENKEKRAGNWTAEPPFWVHGGSLSTSWGHYLSGGKIPDIGHEITIREFESRIAWWTICAEYVDGFDQFKKEYLRAIDELTQRFNFNENRIRHKIKIYRELMDV